MYDSSARSVCFERVTYDYAQAARKIRSAGLAPFFAERLERGQ